MTKRDKEKLSRESERLESLSRAVKGLSTAYGFTIETIAEACRITEEEVRNILKENHDNG